MMYKIKDTPLNPQPRGPSQGAFLDCNPDADGLTFTFFEGNEMEGHYSVYGPIKSPEVGLEPVMEIKNIKEEPVWYWRQRTKPTFNEWLRSQPWYKKEVHG